jgi:phosphoribosyl 1,2-cyclic phosphodiesterase
MFSIAPIASSSAGNSYLLDNGTSRLIVELGIPWRQIKKALNFDLSRVAGAIVTHGHLDHCRAVKEVAMAGIDVYLSMPTADSLKVTGHRIHIVEPMQQFKVDEWTVLPFGVEHDAAGALGFLIFSKAEKILFLTDTSFCRYRFQGITRLMIEANYDQDILERNVAAGLVESSRRERLIKSHMSIQRVVDFLKANDLSKLKEIFLMHLSAENSDEQFFKTTIQQMTGTPVYICGA